MLCMSDTRALFRNESRKNRTLSVTLYLAIKRARSTTFLLLPANSSLELLTYD